MCTSIIELVTSLFMPTLLGPCSRGSCQFASRYNFNALRLYEVLWGCYSCFSMSVLNAWWDWCKLICRCLAFATRCFVILIRRAPFVLPCKITLASENAHKISCLEPLFNRINTASTPGTQKRIKTESCTTSSVPMDTPPTFYENHANKRHHGNLSPDRTALNTNGGQFPISSQCRGQIKGWLGMWYYADTQADLNAT